MMSRRLSALIATASLFAASATNAKQTEWWHTSGAAVIEHESGDGPPACSLFLYDQRQATIVTWHADDRKEIIFNDASWQLPVHQLVPIAVRIGKAWLGDPPDPGRPNLTASTDRQLVSVSVQQPIEDILRDATSIAATMPDRALSMAINHRNMLRSLAAVHRCRATLADSRRTLSPANKGQWR
jgi:hypothetical protein